MAIHLPPGLVLAALGEPVSVFGRGVVDPWEQAKYPKQMEPKEVACTVHQLPRNRMGGYVDVVPETILRSSFKARYSMPPRRSRSWTVSLWKLELRPTVACRDR